MNEKYKIIEKVFLNETTVKMVIDAPLVAKHAKAGQFVILRVDEYGERIPLTISDYDVLQGTVTIIFQIVGATTLILAKQKEKGDYLLDFVGPLGKPSDLNVKKACVIGGGVGCAIALPIAKSLTEKGATVNAIIGFRNKDLVILQEDFERYATKLDVMTDDGSYGEKGYVTTKLEQLLLEEQFDTIYAIGPVIMMKNVVGVAKKYNTKVIVSLNSIMIDGTGMCGSCRVNVGGKTHFACVDGPEFDGTLVDFDELMMRNQIYKEEEKYEHHKTCNLFKGVNE